MALSSCFCYPQGSLKVGLVLAYRTSSNNRMIPSSSFALESVYSKPFIQQAGVTGIKLSTSWSFLGGSRFTLQPKFRRTILFKKDTRVFALWIPPSQIASSVFTLGTAAVLPFYTLMVVAPRAELTKRSVESRIPYIVLGLLYAYLLYLSWTPDTLRYMFASKYWMPELPGIAKMFTNEMTLASAWIHLLAVDLFAARQVYQEGQQNNVETRHSVSLCLLFCPIGILTHFITKALTRSAEKNKNQTH